MSLEYTTPCFFSGPDGMDIFLVSSIYVLSICEYQNWLSEVSSFPSDMQFVWMLIISECLHF